MKDLDIGPGVVLELLQANPVQNVPQIAPRFFGLDRHDQPRPVSYTHLDVYKRQAQNGVIAYRLDRDGLRAAVYRADTDALEVALNDDAWPENAMQLLGDAVLEVACQRPDDIRPAARRCVAALRDRDWEGDAELADQIESAFGWGPTPLLKRLPVDLEELAGVLEGDPLTGGGPVSYTHLDVYKRQGQARVALRATTTPHQLGCSARAGARVFPEGLRVLGPLARRDKSWAINKKAGRSP